MKQLSELHTRYVRICMYIHYVLIRISLIYVITYVHTYVVCIYLMQKILKSTLTMSN